VNGRDPPAVPRGWPGFEPPADSALGASALDEAIERAADREELLHEALRIAGVGGWELDLATGTNSWSEETFHIFGLEPGSVTPSVELFSALMHPEDRARILAAEKQAAASGTMFDEVYRIVRPDGEIRTVKSRAQVVARGRRRTKRFLGIVQDITDKQRIEDKLAEEHAVAEKLQADLIHISRVSAMGAMASALAHELNQPLAAILNYAAALRMLAAKESMAPHLTEVVGAIGDNAHRAGEIIRRLRLMTTRGEVRKAPVELTPCLVEAAHLALTGTDVPVSYDVAPDLRVAADRIQIQQVIVNLVRNAAEAMAGQDQRRIEISARREGGCAAIAVHDTGPGIDPAVLPTIFDSFVSTKQQGMGVGLAISRTIIEAHGGRIGVESAPGRGTTFRLTLPLAEA
jgi:two-component system, LuxR family, sensor kinase FixL